MTSFDTIAIGSLLVEEISGGSYISVVVEKSGPHRYDCLVLGHCIDKDCVPKITITGSFIHSTITRNSVIRVLDPNEVRQTIIRRLRKRKSALDILTGMSADRFKVLRLADFAQVCICTRMSIDEYCNESPDIIDSILREEFKRLASQIRKIWSNHRTADAGQWLCHNKTRSFFWNGGF